MESSNALLTECYMKSSDTQMHEMFFCYTLVVICYRCD